MDVFFTLVLMGGVAVTAFEWGYFRGRRTGQKEVRRVFVDHITNPDAAPAFVSYRQFLGRIARQESRYGWRA